MHPEWHRAKSLQSCLTLCDPMGPASLLCPWGFSRLECWSGLPFLPLRDLPNPEIEPASPTLVGGSFIYLGPPWRPILNEVSKVLSNVLTQPNTLERVGMLSGESDCTLEGALDWEQVICSLHFVQGQPRQWTLAPPQFLPLCCEMSDPEGIFPAPGVLFPKNLFLH